MNHHTTTFDFPSGFVADHDPLRARLRFGAIVRALATLQAGARPPRPAPRPLEDEDAQPTRRLNRIRRLLGRLPKPGKSRNHIRRLR
jgi:hypothetical protein